MLTANGIVLELDFIKNKFGNKYKNLLEKLTIIHTPTTIVEVAPKKVRMYRTYIDKFIMPRGYAKLLYNAKIVTEFINHMPKGRDIDDKLIYGDNVQLKPHQEGICNYICDEVYSNDSIPGFVPGFSLQLGTGLGKTFVAAGLIKRLGVNTLYIVFRKHLAEQAKDDLQKVFPSAEIIIVQTKLEKKTPARKTGDIEICVIDTAIRMPPAYFRKFGFTIFDEVQEYCTDKRSKIFWMAQTQYVFAMTATPGERSDPFDEIYYKAVGEVVYFDKLRAEKNLEAPAQVFNGKVKMIEYFGPDDYTELILNEKTNRPDPTKIRANLEKDPQRNELIVSEAIKLYDKNMNIFIFCETRAHLDVLKEMILAKMNWGVDDFSILRGGAKRGEIAYALKSKIILTTYGYSSTGVSIIKMNAIILGTPRKAKMKQIVGRITRLGSTNEERIVVDICDMRTPFKYQAKKRIIAYDHKGFPVERIRHRYKENKEIKEIAEYNGDEFNDEFNEELHEEINYDNFNDDL